MDWGREPCSGITTQLAVKASESPEASLASWSPSVAGGEIRIESCGMWGRKLSKEIAVQRGPMAC